MPSIKNSWLCFSFPHVSRCKMSPRVMLSTWQSRWLRLELQRVLHHQHHCALLRLCCAHPPMAVPGLSFALLCSDHQPEEDCRFKERRGQLCSCRCKWQNVVERRNPCGCSPLADPLLSPCRWTQPLSQHSQSLQWLGVQS